MPKIFSQFTKFIAAFSLSRKIVSGKKLDRKIAAIAKFIAKAISFEIILLVMQHTSVVLMKSPVTEIISHIVSNVSRGPLSFKNEKLAKQRFILPVFRLAVKILTV